MMFSEDFKTNCEYPFCGQFLHPVSFAGIWDGISVGRQGEGIEDLPGGTRSQYTQIVALGPSYSCSVSIISNDTWMHFLPL